MASLAEQITGRTDAMEILQNGLLSNIMKAEALNGIGVHTTEASIRRWAKAQTDAVVQHEYTRKPAVPKGWEPYSEWSDKIGSAIIYLPRPNATERDLLIESGFDPDCWRIKDGKVNTRKWMAYDQRWLYYYKFDVEAGESEESKWVHVEDLVKRIRQRASKGRNHGFSHLSQGWYVFVMSDWQIGKREGGRGTEDTVQRYKDCLAQAYEDVIRLRKGGAQIDNILILSVGDLVEGCGDHYDMQQFSVDADRRTQNRIVRELFTETILTFSKIFDKIKIAVIGGNHGENRKEGKAYTTFADNDDVGSPEAVMEAFRLAGGLWDERIEWHIPDEDLSMVVDVDGVKIGIVHGHQFRGGANALKKAEDWWRANDFGLQAVREAQILVSGHFHHLNITNVTHGRTWMQAPTIDPGSKWYTDTSGVTAIPGVLTFVATPDSPYGYDHLRVLHPADSGMTS